MTKKAKNPRSNKQELKKAQGGAVAAPRRPGAGVGTVMPTSTASARTGLDTAIPGEHRIFKSPTLPT
jgi:hypothetical protein